MTYNENKRNFTLICVNDEKVKCSAKSRNFHLFDINNGYDIGYVKGIRKNPNVGMLIEGEVSGPPCTVPATVEKFRLDPICNFVKNVSSNKEAFLRLMKFTKQSPVFLEEDDEYKSVFTSVDIKKFGYTLKRNKEVWLELDLELFPI